MKSWRMVAIAIVAIAMRTAYAIFEDEVGLKEWSKQNYGIVTQATVTKTMVVVGTQAGVIAALNANDGSIIWRLVPDTLPTTAVKVSENLLRVYAVTGDTLRCIKANQGSIIWDAPAAITNTGSTLVLSPDGEETLIYLDSETSIAGRNSETGEQKWTWTAPDGYDVHNIAVKGGMVWAALYNVESGSVAVAVARYELGAEKAKDALTVLCQAKCSAPVVTATEKKQPVIACADYSHIYSLVLNGSDDDEEELGNKQPPLQHSVQSTATSSFLAGDVTLASEFALTTAKNDATVLLRVSEKGSVTVATSIAAGAVIAQGDAASEKLRVVSSSVEGVSVLTLQKSSPDNSASMVAVHVEESSAAGVSAAFVARHGSSVLLTTVDGRVLLIDVKATTGKLLWSSDQSLALIKQAIIVLRDEIIQDEVTDKARGKSATADIASLAWEAWKPRLLSQLSSIVATGQQLLDLIQMKSNAASSAEKAALFGFQQTIVVMSSTGRIVALSEKGVPLWSAWYGGEVSAMHQVSHTEILLVSPSCTRLIHAHTGIAVRAPRPLTINHAPTAIIALPKPDTPHHPLPVMILHADGQSSAVEYEIVNSAEGWGIGLPPTVKKGLRWVDLSKDRKTISGKMFSQFSGDSAVTVWSKSFHEPIISVARRPENEVVGSGAIKLGNDGLMLKYLNSNLLAITVEDSPSEITGDDSISNVQLMILDGSAGHVAHYTTLPDAAEPIHMELFENWVVVSYWNSRSKRSEILSLTLWTGALKKFELLPFKALPPVVASMNSVSGAPPTPLVFSRKFAAPGDIATMAVTKTKGGMSSRHLLLGLNTDSLFALDLRWLDPRRPDAKPTAEEQLEMLIQYNAIIPLIPASMLSYNLTVASIEGIVVSPSSLESTCHVFAFGLDLFYSRHLPSKGFDLLPDDFNKPLLLALIIGMTIALGVLKAMHDTKKLKQAWM